MSYKRGRFRGVYRVRGHYPTRISRALYDNVTAGTQVLNPSDYPPPASNIENCQYSFITAGKRGLRRAIPIPGGSPISLSEDRGFLINQYACLTYGAVGSPGLLIVNGVSTYSAINGVSTFSSVNGVSA